MLIQDPTFIRTLRVLKFWWKPDWIQFEEEIKFKIQHFLLEQFDQGKFFKAERWQRICIFLWCYQPKYHQRKSLPKCCWLWFESTAWFEVHWNCWPSKRCWFFNFRVISLTLLPKVVPWRLNQIKHEYLWSCAYKCLSLSSVRCSKKVLYGSIEILVLISWILHPWIF